MRAPDPVVLAHGAVRLEPLTAAHAPELHRACADPAVWRWLSTPAPMSAAEMDALVARATADARRLAWAVRLDGRVVGSTSYLDVDLDVEGLEIGWTFTSPAVWAGVVNPTCKLLLLAHAFDDLGCARVTLKTDALNTRSRAAILRLGASYDGTLRHHRLRSDGSVRDSAYYSVLSSDWPGVRAGLLDRLPPSGTACAS